MAYFKCRVSDKSGKIIEFTEEADSETDAAGIVSDKGYYPLNIKIIDVGSDFSSKNKKFPKSTILEFTQTLSMMINSGLTIKDSLEISRSIFKKGKTHQLVNFLLGEMRNGESFYSAVEKTGNSFPPVYRGLLRISDRIGNPGSVMVRMSKYLEDDKKMREKVTGSLIYPFMILSVAVIGIMMIVLVIFPRIEEMFRELGQGMPAEIKNALGFVNNFSTVIGVLFFILLSSFFILFILNRTNRNVRFIMDKLLLKIPVVGTVINLNETLNFLFAMETLILCNITVETALDESSMVLKNLYYSRSVLQIKKRIIKGQDLSSAFLEEKALPERIGLWVGIGEKTGKVGEVFTKLRNYYQGEIEKWSERFMMLIEPALILLVGIMILIMIIFFIIPIFSAFGNII